MSRRLTAAAAAVGCVAGFQSKALSVVRCRDVVTQRRSDSFALVWAAASSQDPQQAIEQLVEVHKDGSRRKVFGEESRRSTKGRKRRRAKSVLQSVFVPEAVTPAYYSYSAWRCLQRLLSATVNVFGLQAMIMAVGAREAVAGRAISAAAAADWVLKDALGKVTRLVWAGRMGREFDGDAKRWRFRSSLLYATGNGLQIATFAAPHLFLVLATLANCLKQISLLTSTATRSAIYRSFAATEATNNIGDVTAKGEAQIAIVDLLGMSLGIALSRSLGFGDALASRDRLIALYASLSALEIGAMYKEIRCVVFQQLNLERVAAVVDAFVANDQHLPTPTHAAERERILFSAPRSIRDTFPTPSKALNRLAPSDVADILAVFRDQAYILTPIPSRRYGVVLGTHAADIDILESLLALAYAEQIQRDSDRPDPAVLQQAKLKAQAHLGDLLDAMHGAGWSTSSFMFPNIPERLHWPNSTDPVRNDVRR